jgi:hypothetical protein
LVSDIPAGNGKLLTFFYSVQARPILHIDNPIVTVGSSIALRTRKLQTSKTRPTVRLQRFNNLVGAKPEI